MSSRLITNVLLYNVLVCHSAPTHSHKFGEAAADAAQSGQRWFRGGNGQESHPIRRGGRVRGGAVQGQPRRGVPPRGRSGGGGRAVDAVRRRRVQPLRDRLPRPRLLQRRHRTRPAVPPPLVHPRRRGRLASIHLLRKSCSFLLLASFGTRKFSRSLVLDSSRSHTPSLFQVELCGHATLASAHFLFTSVLARHDMVEFATKSGILTAKKVPAPESTGVSGEEEQGKLFIELDFPMDDLVDCNSAEVPSIPETLNGAPIVSVHKSATAGDLIVELSSGKEVADIIPNIDEIKKCAGRGVIVTGPAPAGSGYDFFTRFFCPKFGIDEDPVCGSAHCFLAPYWGGKLGKQKLTAFQASPRSGILYLELEDAARRVRIQGEAVTVMAGTLLA